jgi:flagellar basal body-associated protein FliL
VIGVVIILVVLLIVLPVTILVVGAITATVLGATLKSYGERSHEGSELIDLNR